MYKVNFFIYHIHINIYMGVYGCYPPRLLPTKTPLSISASYDKGNKGMYTSRYMFFLSHDVTPLRPKAQIIKYCYNDFTKTRRGLLMRYFESMS